MSSSSRLGPASPHSLPVGSHARRRSGARDRAMASCSRSRPGTEVQSPSIAREAARRRPRRRIEKSRGSTARRQSCVAPAPRSGAAAPQCRRRVRGLPVPQRSGFVRIEAWHPSCRVSSPSMLRSESAAMPGCDGETSVLPIVTLTMNPAIDVSASVDYVTPDHKLRCEAPTYEPGGGGINVARAIRKLGGDALALFPGRGPGWCSPVLAPRRRGRAASDDSHRRLDAREHEHHRACDPASVPFRHAGAHAGRARVAVDPRSARGPGSGPPVSRGEREPAARCPGRLLRAAGAAREAARRRAGPRRVRRAPSPGHGRGRRRAQAEPARIRGAHRRAEL